MAPSRSLEPPFPVELSYVSSFFFSQRLMFFAAPLWFYPWFEMFFLSHPSCPPPHPLLNRESWISLGERSPLTRFYYMLPCRFPSRPRIPSVVAGFDWAMYVPISGMVYFFPFSFTRRESIFEDPDTPIRFTALPCKLLGLAATFSLDTFFAFH